jgi:tRNA nucleotidyltransferase (CCA-adding enzyme)
MNLSIDTMLALQRAVPPAVHQVCQALSTAGHQAVAVGGAVRDVILGRQPGDWDVATSALPQDVVALFRRTIPTGIAHGTVSVVLGAGADNVIEVTTYRGEGHYTDARRPDNVTFGVGLQQDLARRDLVVNAIAYDPIAHIVFDPFGGIEDIHNKVIRAVGDPVARFTEDGLRVIRALRFAATLEFAIEKSTAQALTVALPSLNKVARERVCTECTKMLMARQPSLGLAPALEYGVLENIAPALTAQLRGGEQGAVAQWLQLIDSSVHNARLAAFAAPVYFGYGSIVAETMLKALKWSNLDVAAACLLCATLQTVRAEPLSLPAARRLLGRLAVSQIDHVLSLWRAYDKATASSVGEAWAKTVSEVRTAGDATTVKDLCVDGKILMRELELAPSRAVGDLLAQLLELVLLDPGRNQKEQLLAAARAILQTSSA